MKLNLLFLIKVLLIASMISVSVSFTEKLATRNKLSLGLKPYQKTAECNNYRDMTSLLNIKKSYEREYKLVYGKDNEKTVDERCVNTNFYFSVFKDYLHCLLRTDIGYEGYGQTERISGDSKNFDLVFYFVEELEFEIISLREQFKLDESESESESDDNSSKLSSKLKILPLAIGGKKSQETKGEIIPSINISKLAIEPLSDFVNEPPT